MKVSFFHGGRLDQQLMDEWVEALNEVIGGGSYILGRRVIAFEQVLAAFLKSGGPGDAVGCNSGTDAIRLALLALGIGPGDEVITVSHTAIPTATAIVSVGALPVFAEIDPDTWVMDAERLPERVGPRTKAVIPVHLYGNMADVDRIQRLLADIGRPDIAVIEDTAQAFGSTWSGRQAGTIGDFGAFSFYPTKNLGALGDAGAVFCQAPEAAERIRMLRHYGQRDRYRADLTGGINSRLDELQAAFLTRKLPSVTGSGYGKASASRY